MQGTFEDQTSLSLYGIAEELARDWVNGNRNDVVKVIAAHRPLAAAGLAVTVFELLGCSIVDNDGSDAVAFANRLADVSLNGEES